MYIFVAHIETLALATRAIHMSYQYMYFSPSCFCFHWFCQMKKTTDYSMDRVQSRRQDHRTTRLIAFALDVRTPLVTVEMNFFSRFLTLPTFSSILMVKVSVLSRPDTLFAFPFFSSAVRRRPLPHTDFCDSSTLLLRRQRGVLMPCLFPPSGRAVEELYKVGGELLSPHMLLYGSDDWCIRTRRCLICLYPVPKRSIAFPRNRTALLP